MYYPINISPLLGSNMYWSTDISSRIESYALIILTFPQAQCDSHFVLKTISCCPRSVNHAVQISFLFSSFVSSPRFTVFSASVTWIWRLRHGRRIIFTRHTNKSLVKTWLPYIVTRPLLFPFLCRFLSKPSVCSRMTRRDTWTLSYMECKRWSRSYGLVLALVL